MRYIFLLAGPPGGRLEAERGGRSWLCTWHTPTLSQERQPSPQLPMGIIARRLLLSRSLGATAASDDNGGYCDPTSQQDDSLYTTHDEALLSNIRTGSGIVAMLSSATICECGVCC